MKRIAWLTDLHFEFVREHQIAVFCEQVKALSPDVVLVGGDTGNAPTVCSYLTHLEQQLQRPIYFVLGNHDFYGGSIQQVRSQVGSLSQQSRWLHWLNTSGVVALGAHTALIGHDGWGDGRLGHGVRSNVVLNDFAHIRELTGLLPMLLFERLQRLGDEAAVHFTQMLPQALEHFRNVMLLTHVPPFKEACWHEGRISDDNFLPHFTCSAVGDVLREMMSTHPESQMTVLCGHTHGQGEARLLPNLHVKTGGAEYGQPQVQAVFTVE